ncbi:MAG: SufD family Fe-S cluster assembly protein, partial [Anaerolineae bacterium]|nr:SufD family Fe-S cluster assembly protein [Anaerolineae bacterium]
MTSTAMKNYQTVAPAESLTLEMNRDTIDALSDYYREPQWMRAARHSAWATYEQLDWPQSKDEAWRRIPLDRYPLEGQHIAIAPQPVDSIEGLPPCWLQSLAPEEQVAGMLVHYNGVPAYAELNAMEQAKGVVFSDLHAALHTHGDIIRRYWMQGVTTRPDFNKFTALNAALWYGGTFVYVPEGQRVNRPLQALAGYNAQGGAGIHHTLIIARKGAHVNLVLDRISQESEPALNAEVVEIIAEEGAWIRYASLQHWGDKSHTVSVQEARLARNSHIRWISGSLGGQVTKEFLRSELLEPGARAVMQGFNFPSDHQIMDQSTYQHHVAPDAYSDLLFRNVLRDQSR